MARRAFTLFKWMVYGLLAVNTVMWLRVDDTITAFLDSAAWLVLLGVMEYESTTMDEAYGRAEKWVIAGLSAFAYGMIVFAWWGYIMERDWLDVANASAWLGVCAVLAYQIWVPGEYEGQEHAVITSLKTGLYAVLVGCALWWTLDAKTLLDPIDAWLWILCFAVIELNVFGFEHRSAEGGPGETA